MNIKCICEICGKEFEVIPYRIKIGGGKYCSNKCRWTALISTSKGNIYHKGHKHSIETRLKMSRKRQGTNKGEKNHNWKGGIKPITEKIRASNKYQEWRQQIFIRDNFTCQECGQIGGKLEVHHIKSFRILIKEVKNYLPLLDLYDGAMTYTPLWDLDNGITLCKGCHSKMKKGKYKL